MSERVFLSYNYERDSARAGLLAASVPTSDAVEFAGLIGPNEWRQLERLGPTAQQQWVDTRLAATSVTAVLISGHTERAPWVHYEIQQSRARGHGLIGIHVHRLADPRTGLCDYKGRNPFEMNLVPGPAPAVPFSDIYPVYDWVVDGGASHLAQWIREAGDKARSSQQTANTRRPGSQPAVHQGAFPTFRHVEEDWSPAEFIAEP